MAKVCDVSGKKTQVGNNVSYAKNRTKRKFYPNLQKQKFYIPETDTWIYLKVTTSVMRTMNKNGVIQTLRKAKQKGTLSKHLWYLTETK